VVSNDLASSAAGSVQMGWRRRYGLASFWPPFLCSPLFGPRLSLVRTSQVLRYFRPLTAAVTA
jgi:hypothetical protein